MKSYSYSTYFHPLTEEGGISEQCKTHLAHLPVNYQMKLETSLTNLDAITESLNNLCPSQVPVVHESHFQEEVQFILDWGISQGVSHRYFWTKNS